MLVFILSPRIRKSTHYSPNDTTTCIHLNKWREKQNVEKEWKFNRKNKWRFKQCKTLKRKQRTKKKSLQMSCGLTSEKTSLMSRIN